MLLMGTGALIGKMLDWGDLWLLFLLIFAVQLYQSIKRFYRQGNAKTLLKFMAMAMAYPIILTVFIVVASLISLFFF